jgi:hypothetical protein
MTIACCSLHYTTLHATADYARLPRLAVLNRGHAR